MTDWYFLAAPIAVLAVLLLFRFVGCSFDPVPEETYETTVLHDSPVAYLRLREKPGDTIAKNVIGPPDGTIGVTPLALDAGDPNWRSTQVDHPAITLGVTDPHLVQTSTAADYSAPRFNGGFVEVPANVAPLNNLTEFTVEVLVHPEWDTEFALGKYYCVLESADVVQVSGNPQLQKNAGFGLYAGPDNINDPTSPYIWQFWMGVGLDGFERLFPVLPYSQPSTNPVPNPGPVVQPEPTYIAVTFSTSLNQAILYVFNPNRDLDYTTYALNPAGYLPAAQSMFVGITPQGPLFQPFQGPTLLYPFKGLIGDVAVYDKVLDESTIRNHVINLFFNS